MYASIHVDNGHVPQSLLLVNRMHYVCLRITLCLLPTKLCVINFTTKIKFTGLTTAGTEKGRCFCLLQVLPKNPCT